MSGNKADLSLALADVGGSARKRPPAPKREKPAKAEITKAEVSKEKPTQQPGRAGAYAITSYFPKEVRDRLKILAIRQSSTLQDLSAEAYNDLFAKYGEPEIAPLLKRD